jgi:hypothetical protein
MESDMAHQDIWDDKWHHLQHLPDGVLRDLARNESAARDYRRFAVELLANRKSEMVKHPEFAPFLLELKIELEGIEFESPVSSGGALIASITTETMFCEEIVLSA